MKILRHNQVIRFIHWSTALSIFILLFSGFGQMPVYKRYFVDTLPGLSWSSNYWVTLNIHYYAAVVLIFSSIYYVTYIIMSKKREILPQKGDFKESMQIFASLVGLAEEPPSGKYLAEQRLAFSLTAFTTLVLILTGIIKVYKNIPGINLSAEVVFWTAQIHNLFTVIMVLNIIAHLGAFLLRPNWPLVPSMFSGYINADYIKHRHQKWWQELNGNDNADPAEPDPEVVLKSDVETVAMAEETAEPETEVLDENEYDSSHLVKTDLDAEKVSVN